MDCMVSFPPLPPIQGDLILAVFTHKSLRHSGAGNDNERYALLGEKAFEVAVTYSIFLRYPEFSKEQIEAERAKLTSDSQYQTWVDHYHLFDKLRFNPAAEGEVYSRESTRELFHAYLGALYYGDASGPATVNSWVYRLLAPPGKYRAFSAAATPPPLVQSPPSSHALQLFNLPSSQTVPPRYSTGLPESDIPATSLTLPNKRKRSCTSFSERSPPPPSLPPPPSPPLPPSSAPFVHQLPKPTAYLPKFNEKVAKSRLRVQWLVESSGPQHSLQWHVDCVVNDRVYGSGAAHTKQLAKEDAAKQAFYALGFKMLQDP